MGRIFQITSEADPEMKNLTSNFISIDHEFAELYNLEIIIGRDFEFSDHNFNGRNIKNLIIYESAVSHLKFSSPEEAIGKSVNFNNKDWTVIGVFKDFHKV